MKLYRRGQPQVPLADVEAAKHIMAARVQAELRVGDSVETRLNWVLTFLQRDLDALSPGDWLNLCDEIRMYGSPLPQGGTGYYGLDVSKGHTMEGGSASPCYLGHKCGRFKDTCCSSWRISLRARR
jgi:hypothetical protein